MSSYISLIDLPWEDVLITRILPHLDVLDIFRLRCLSRDFCDLVQAYFKHQKTFNWTRVASRTTFDAFLIATSEAENLHKLVVTTCKSWLVDDKIVPVIERNQRLRYIDLSECSGLTCRTINKIAGTCPDLQTILLRECHWVSSPMVESLTMKCNNLERIDLTGCWELTDDTIYMLASLQPKLRWLSLAKIYGITQASIEQLAMNCYHLEHLDLEGCWRVTDAAIHKLAQKCPNLKNLKVRDCRNITERSLSHLRLEGVSIDIKGVTSRPRPDLQVCPVDRPNPPVPMRHHHLYTPINYRL